LIKSKAKEIYADERKQNITRRKDKDDRQGFRIRFSAKFFSGIRKEFELVHNVDQPMPQITPLWYFGG